MNTTAFRRASTDVLGIALSVTLLSPCAGAQGGLHMSEQKTAKGTPIAHMWACPTPDPTKPGAGYPVLTEATHARLYRATRETGGYSHHSRLIVHGGCFYAMWSNHPHGEDGPGQRVLFATSRDGATWDQWRELFPPPGPVKAWEDNGLVFSAGGWAVHEGRLFARAGCYADVGFESSDRTSFSPTRDRKHKFRKRRHHCAFAREVRADGSLGGVFPLGRKRPPKGDITCPYKTAPDQLTRALQRLFRGRRRPTAVDTNRLCEPTHYRAKDGKHVCLLRDDTYSHRLYVSVTDDARKWPPAVPTDIPDSPSLSTTVTLDDGTVLLIGNQMAPKFDNPRERTHYQRDPLTISISPDGYQFTRVYALRTGQQEFRVPGVGGRGGGGQYPSALVHEGILYVQYSMGKEDIWVTSVPLVALQLKVIGPAG